MDREERGPKSGVEWRWARARFCGVEVGKWKGGQESLKGGSCPSLAWVPQKQRDDIEQAITTRTRMHSSHRNFSICDNLLL